MKQVSTDELTKISAFIASCNDMINGKFILADIKILKILKMISASEELYRYITSCLVDFDFTKELHRAEVKNRFNGGDFVLPEDPAKVVAMVFNLLVEFNTKRLDFYAFIRNNFSTVTEGTEYKNFSKKVLVPFRDIVAKEFGLSIEIQSEPNTETVEIDKVEKELSAEVKVEEKKEPTIWEKLNVSTNTLIDAVKNERKIKSDLKEELLYLLNTIKHSLQYEDMHITNALFSSVNLLTKKFRSVKFLLTEIEQNLIEYYSKKSEQN